MNIENIENDNWIAFISTAELIATIEDKNLRLLDVRPVESYNGWHKPDESRGGHIIRAKSLPAKWTNYIDWIEIVMSKDILPEHLIVVYGNSKAEAVAELFQRAGYPNIRIYEEFNQWRDNPELPMNRLARYRHLVSAEWLKELLATGNGLEYDNDKFTLCHGHYRNSADYNLGHIPGAIEIDSLWLESPETWNRRSPAELKSALEKMGITFDTTVILYGRFSSPNNDDPFPGSSAGHLGAIRCAMIMMYAGVEDVRILNGGLQSWQDAGYDITTDETIPTPVTDFGVTIPNHPEIIVDIDEAKEILKSPDKNLVSVRSWAEYIGKVSGYNYIEKKGRIPGSVFGDCGSDAYHMENYRNLDHTIREYHEVERIWAKAGITADKKNAFYCGTGWRGSEAFLNAWLMGWENVSVFDGGWFEWSNDPSNPYETGVPE